MSIIGPHLTLRELRTGARHTERGRGLRAPLPGVAADAHEMDRRAHRKNRELAKRIRAVVAEHKPSDGKVPRFVWAFRMYPNAESKYWTKAVAEHRCGCSCGAACSCGTSTGKHPPKKRKTRRHK
jgi:hypothetical protein